MTRFTVIGAGMAGLFAAAMLRDECLAMHEAQNNLPNNHAALLRFRSSVVGDVLNIPFRKVNVIKTVETLGNPVADAISYSLKTTGQVTLRSVLTAEGKLEERYIAPEDFVVRLYNKVTAPVHFDSRWNTAVTSSSPTISTMPMPVLMGLLGYPDKPDFRYVAGTVTRARIKDCAVCATIYFPDRMKLPYRASITDDTMIIERAFPMHGTNPWDPGAIDRFVNDRDLARRMVEQCCERFGISSHWIDGEPVTTKQQYAKILPIDDDSRKRFILWASENYGIYSFGRFATWRPGLLLDDLVHDLRVIQKLVNGGSSYDARRR